MNIVNLGSWAAEFDNNGLLWFSDFNYGGLYKYDLNKRKIILEHFFEDIEIDTEALHRRLIVRNNEILLFPLNDSYVRIYNIDEKKERKINMPDQFLDGKIIENDKKVWAISFDGCYKFDFEIEKFIKDDFLSNIFSLIDKEERCNIRINATDNYIIACNNSSKSVISIDLINMNYKQFNLNFINEKIQDIFLINQRYWILLEDSYDVYSRDIDDESYIKYEAETRDLENHNIFAPYSRIIQWENHLILPNYYGKSIMKINLNNKTIEPLYKNELDNQESQWIDYGAYYYRTIVYEDYLFFIPQRSKYILKFDKNLNLVDKYLMQNEVNAKFIEDVMVSRKRKSVIMHEDDKIFSVDNYLKCIRRLEESKNVS